MDKIVGWFNFFGLGIVVLILVPNIIYAISQKPMTKIGQNKTLNLLEQIGRYGSMTFMIFNVPHAYFDFFFDGALWVYLIVDGMLVAGYLLIWALLWKKNGLWKAILLSVIPTLIFFFSAIILRNIPLLAASILFGIGHITISIKNALNERKE